MYAMQLAFFLSLDLFNAWVNNNWRQQFWDCVAAAVHLTPARGGIGRQKKLGSFSAA